MVCYDKTIFVNLESDGAKKSKYWENHLKSRSNEVLSNVFNNQKLSFNIFMVGNLLNIFMEHDLNILMIFGITEKSIILTHTVYCCLLLQIYLCCLWLRLCSRDTYRLHFQTFIWPLIVIIQWYFCAPHRDMIWSSSVCLEKKHNKLRLNPEELCLETLRETSWKDTELFNV